MYNISYKLVTVSIYATGEIQIGKPRKSIPPDKEIKLDIKTDTQKRNKAWFIQEWKS